MIDSFDYKEPSCVLCEGKEFYNPKDNDVKGRIPVKRIIEKLDGLLNKNNLTEAQKLLEYWQSEAVALNDKHGELSVVNELIGLYRKISDKNNAYSSINRAISLTKDLGLNGVSYATVTLNIATAYKAFGEPEKALYYYGITEEIYDNNLDKKDDKFAGLYNNKALALVDVKDYKNAESYYKKAIDILKDKDFGLLDSAITYVNLAHLYEKFDNSKITDSLFTAYNLIFDERVERNGYFAYVCSKCAPSYKYFGFYVIEKELSELSEKIYERN